MKRNAGTPRTDRGRMVPLVIVGSGAVAILVGALLLFEVYPRKITHGQSAEVRENPYFALERWLEAEGIAVRVMKGATEGEVAGARESLVIASVEGLDWGYDGPEALGRWLSEGGKTLLLFFHDPPDEQSFLSKRADDFLEEVGIEYEVKRDSSRADGTEKPSFDRRMRFRDGMEGAEDGWTELLEKRLGKGTLVVSGHPWFLANRELEGEANAELAWSLTGARAEARGGILIVLPAEEQAVGVAGILARGWWPALLISLFLLLGIFLWRSLAPFGPASAGVKEDWPGIGERLRAEARFLARWGALEGYLDQYRAALAARMRARGEDWDPGSAPPRQRISELTGMELSALERALPEPLSKRRKMTKKAFFDFMRILETTLERL